MKKSDIFIIYTTTSNREEAKRIARLLLEKRLVACVNIFPKVESIYWWMGKVEEAEETAMIAKTTESKVKEVIDAIKSMHSYEVPAIIAIPIFDGSDSYIKYVKEECKEENS